MTWLAVLVLAATAWLAAANLADKPAASAQTRQLQSVQSRAETVFSTLKEAETGQRGYLLTGDLGYLRSYMLARERLDRDLASLATAPMSGDRRHSRMDIIRDLAAAKMVELHRSVTLLEAGMTAAALEVVRTNESRRTMEAIRAEVDALELESMTPLAVAAAEDASLPSWAPVVVLGKAIFGLAAEAPAGFQTLADTIGAEHRSAIKAVLARAVDPVEPDDHYAFEHRLQQGACQDVWIAAAGKVLFQPYPDAPAGRRPVRSFGIVRDISRTRHQQEDQYQAGLLLRTIVEASSGLIYAKDLQGRMLLANASVMNLIGKPWDQVRGRRE